MSKILDSIAAHELALFASNNEKVFTRFTAPTVKNLAKKYNKGIFDDENGCTTKRILSSDNRYYYHEMHNGNIVQCFEIALSWKPFPNMFVFAFTPDNIHEYRIDVRTKENSRPDENTISNYDIVKVDTSRLENGMQCSYKEHTVILIDNEHINFDGKIITVTIDYEFVWKLLKTKIKAIDGARGLFSELDKIAENGKFEKFPLLESIYSKIYENFIA